MKTLDLINKLKADNKSARRKFNSSPINKKLFPKETDKPPEFKDTTFLYIRAMEGDSGARPLAADIVFWNSPDIELYDANNTLITTNELKQGKKYTVSVVVHNDGDMTCNSCVIELFICDFSVGFDPAYGTKVGIQSMAISGHDKVTAKFSFVPGQTNMGHQCLFARAYSYVNGDLPLSSSQFSVSEDRHVGQQNIAVVTQSSSLTFNVFPGELTAEKTFKIMINRKKKELSKYKLPVLADFITTKNAIKNDKLILRKATETMVERTPMKALSKNLWKHALDQRLNRIVLDIPDLRLSGKEAVIYEVEVANDETGQRLGGLTIVVTP
ncbi:MAG: hypothetical protein V2B19_19335 [Pseudomonadota bacterium]